MGLVTTVGSGIGIKRKKRKFGAYAMKPGWAVQKGLELAVAGMRRTDKDGTDCSWNEPYRQGWDWL